MSANEADTNARVKCQYNVFFPVLKGSLRFTYG